MDIEHCSRCTPIPIDKGKIRNMTFDGCYYYFILHEKIIKTDLRLRTLCQYQIDREYSYMCYDWEGKQFWASSPAQNDVLYKLDCKFNEIDCVALKGCLNYTGPITGLTYECYCSKIMIAFDKVVVRVNKNGDYERCLNMPNVQIVGLLSLYPGCIITALKGNREYLYLWPPNGGPREIYSLQQDVSVQSMVFNPCCSKEANVDCLVFTSGKPPQLCQIPLEEFQLGYHPWECNYDICNGSCKTPEPKPINCNDILESIALEEAAIAHILNAEGEKIQKILSLTDDFDKIMCVNQEVNETIVNVTILEQTLYAKLLSVSKMQPFECAQTCCNTD